MKNPPILPEKSKKKAYLQCVDIHDLPEREQEVFQFLIQDYSVSKIANHLNISIQPPQNIARIAKDLAETRSRFACLVKSRL